MVQINGTTRCKEVFIHGKNDIPAEQPLEKTDPRFPCSYENKSRPYCSEEKKRKISEAQKGRVHKNEAQNKAHSELMKGKTPWNKGRKVWTDEDKLRISQQTKGRKMSAESSEKKRLAMQAYFERKKAAKK
jgi:hypothetical protein